MARNIHAYSNLSVRAALVTIVFLLAEGGTGERFEVGVHAGLPRAARSGVHFDRLLPEEDGQPEAQTSNYSVPYLTRLRGVQSIGDGVRLRLLLERMKQGEQAERSTTTFCYQNSLHQSYLPYKG